MIKLSFLPSFLLSWNSFFLFLIVCPHGEGINVPEGSGTPHGNCRLESLTMHRKFLKEGQKYAWALNFLIHTPNGSYNRALKNLCLSFHFCCSLSMAVHCTDCVLELNNSSPQVFLQFYKGLLHVNDVLGSSLLYSLLAIRSKVIKWRLSV